MVAGDQTIHANNQTVGGAVYAATYFAVHAMGVPDYLYDVYSVAWAAPGLGHADHVVHGLISLLVRP